MASIPFEPQAVNHRGALAGRVPDARVPDAPAASLAGVIVDIVPLRWTPEAGLAVLRELTGADEAALASAGTAAAVALLDGLLQPAAGAALRPGQAASLCAAERDRLLAAVYTRTYGPRVRSTLACRACSRRFDLDFSLPELVASLEPEWNGSVQPEPGGAYLLGNGARVRLPSAADELAVAALPPDQAEQALLAACVLEPPAAGPLDVEELQAALAQIAPLVDLDLEATCPECGQDQPVHFELQGYLLASLQAEQLRLYGEVHRLALAYHWSRAEILSLPRRERRAYLELIYAYTS